LGWLFDSGNVYIKNNLGIGVSPTYKLQVSGNSYLAGNATTTGSLNIGGVVGTGEVGIGTNPVSGSGLWYLKMSLLATFG
jgi:hypothetical protein